MKTLIFSLLLFSTTTFAEEKFTFVWRMNVDKGYDMLTWEVSANSYVTALEKASNFCFDYFKNKRPMTEEWGLTVIDTCVNPSNK